MKKEGVKHAQNHFITTGVPGLDEVLKGGVREKASILVTGVPGTGKTILALQFLIDGARQGQAGLIITAEDTSASLREYGKTLGWDIQALETKGLLTIVEQKIGDGKIISIEVPLQLIQKNKIKRVVLDSLTLFEFVYSSSIEEFRKGVLHFLSTMRNSDVTLLVTAERTTLDVDTFQFRPEDFLFEGLIILTRVRKGSSYERVVTVAKMRGQDHLIGIYPFTIGTGGISIFPKELPFSLLERERKK